MKSVPAQSESRWVVAHLGARDRYQLPIAMHEAGLLHRFVTDWYSPLDRPLIGSAVQCLPKSMQTRLAHRFSADLPSRKVLSLKNQMILGARRGQRAPDLNRNRLLGQAAARVAAKSESNLLITSYYGWAAFPLLPKDTRKVLFQVHPQPQFLRELYLACNGGAGFEDELELQWDQASIRTWGAESIQADLVIAASSFTKRSLIETGVDPNRIVVVPYGVDTNVFRNDRARPTGSPKILFVGQDTPRKALRELLRVWNNIGSKDAELHIICGAKPSPEMLASKGRVIWHGRLPLNGVIATMNQSDLLVLPSIAEGFGHVLLESLACGTPIFCSDATAGIDLLRGWQDEFVFPAQDWNRMAAGLDYWIRNVAHLRNLRTEARRVAERHTWARFREQIRDACRLAAAQETAAEVRA